MRRHLAIVFASIGLAAALPTISAERLRAHCQVNVEIGKIGAELKRFQIDQDVTAGVPIYRTLPMYGLSLLITRGHSDAYRLTVVLVNLEESNHIVLKRSFNGKLVSANVGPMEFEANGKEVAVSGAIALSALKQSN